MGIGTGSMLLASGQRVASQPVAVFAGHDCTQISWPDGRTPACDHLEEQLFPNETWGRDYFVSALRDRGTSTPNVVRIVSQQDNNRITYDPASVRPSETLNAGQMVEFAATASFRATGTRA